MHALMDIATFERVLFLWMGFAVIIAVVLGWIKAPYGRHATARGGLLPSWLGWLLMEAPSPLGLALLFALGHNRGAGTLAFLALWELHYLHRTLIYPLRRSSLGSPMPAYIALLGLCFNLVNAGTNGLWLFSLGPDRGVAWLADPRFIVGLALFFGGLSTNIHADEVLRRLRRPGERGYHIPHGGLYRYISCPNYFGEIVEWWGFALLTWSVSGLAFAVWTTANLLPRALAHHRWYQEKFPDYPTNRRAVLPGVL